MTNEEKAIEIVSNTPGFKDDNGGTILTVGHCHQAVMNMAEWKDYQFKEYLEKKKREFPDYCDKFLAEHYDACTIFLERIINELFGGK